MLQASGHPAIESRKVGQAIGLHAERLQAAQPGKRHSRSPYRRKRLSHPNLAQVSSLCSDIPEFLKQCTGIMRSVRLQENYVALG